MIAFSLESGAVSLAGSALRGHLTFLLRHDRCQNEAAKLRFEEQRPPDPGVAEMNCHGLASVIAKFMDFVFPVRIFSWPDRTTVMAARAYGSLALGLRHESSQLNLIMAFALNIGARGCAGRSRQSQKVAMNTLFQQPGCGTL
jgi:hypothetical protein